MTTKPTTPPSPDTCGERSGPLVGIRIVELSGLGPAPMASMMLADMGADVIRVERHGSWNPLGDDDISFRGKRSVVINLKNPTGIDLLLDLIETADVFIDPYRPGVCERMGIGPDTCLDRNPRLVYGRMTGWGQTGPLAHASGHDINYIAITGALHAVGERVGRPMPALNLLGDMAGGGMLLWGGILAALLEASISGTGQVIDASMVDGTAQLMWLQHGMLARGDWDHTRRESNMLDGGAHFYNTYECADGEYVCVGSIEPQFYAMLIEKTGVDPEQFADQHSQIRWPELRAELNHVFRKKTRDEWCKIMEGTDVCFAPVLDIEEAPRYHANAERDVYIKVGGVTQPAPAPRFSRTPSRVSHPPRPIGADTQAVLRELGYLEETIERFSRDGVVSGAS